MQGLRKGEWPAITQVKVFSPEICLIALGQGFLHLEASSAARDNGECVSGVPGSEAMAGHSMVHSGTWESHIVPNSEALNSLKGGHLGVIRLLVSEFAPDREKGGTDCPISVSWHLENPLRQLGGDDV